jgi:hypothetical protein
MCQDLNFYPSTSIKYKHHYTLKRDEGIKIPHDYDFRSEYYIKKDDFWYFSRKIFFWNPRFSYNVKTRTLSFNRAYQLFPIKIGDLFTLGEHLSNLIDLNLFLDNHVCLRGIAYQGGGQNICLTAPGFNGKTTLLKQKLKEGAKYIAEDYLVLGLDNFTVYPTCPLSTENFWRRRKIGKELSTLIGSENIVKKPVKIDELYFAENHQSNLNSIKSSTLDCMLLNSLYFLNNLFIKSYLYDSGSSRKLFDNIKIAEQKLVKSKFIFTKNFSYPIS